MKSRWLNTNDFGTSISFLASRLKRKFPVSLGSPGSPNSPYAQGEKTVCGACGTVHRTFYDRKIRRVRDLSCGDMRVYLDVEGIATFIQLGEKVSLGFVEGLNNKIPVIQRRAYGLRDEEYLRLKVLTCLLPAIQGGVGPSFRWEGVIQRPGARPQLGG
jgi:hypothetical protein